MSWFQSVRDDLTLRPFELQHTHSDSAAMASGPPDVSANQEPAEVVEECTGKKKSKFQTFKKFFARKKRKEPPAPGADARIKASQSSDNVSKTSENNTLTRSEKDKGSGSKISLGSKALSHDSVFVSDSSEANEALGASQDSIHGKVKSLQLQLKQAMRLGSPPSLMCVKRTEDAGTMSEDDGLPCSPPEYTTPHTVMNQAQRNSSISLEGKESDDNQLSCTASNGAVSPLVVPGDFSQPASPFGCLDNSAAKHKLGLRYKACNKRKPISRFEIKAKDSVVEKRMNNSIMVALEEQQKTTEVLDVDELKPKVEREDESEDEVEEEEEEEEEEKEQPQHSRKSMLSDKEEKEEGESDAEQEVSHDPDASSSPELSEEETTDAQPPPSSKTSSRTSSLGSPRATPEPPTGPTEYSPNPPGFIDEADENTTESGLRGEENEVQDNIEEEETSFLQEVLSSLKTPLVSCSLDTETECIVQDIEEEVKEQGGGDLDTEEDEEVRKEEIEVNQPASYRVAPAGFVLSHPTPEEEEEVDPLNTCAPVWQHVEEEKVEDKEEEAAVEEEKDHDEDDEDDDTDDEEEELVVEQFSKHDKKEEGEEEEAEEVNPEEQNNMLTGNTVNQAEKERGSEEESEEEEEEAVASEELEKEPEEEEEGRESWEVVEVKGAKEIGESTEAAAAAEEEERDDAGETIEVIPGVAAEEVKIVMKLQEADEGEDVVVGDDTMFTPQQADDDQAHEGQEASRQIFSDEREDGEEVGEEEGELDHTEGKSEQEEDSAANQPEPDRTEDVEREGMEIPYLDLRREEKDQTDVPSKPPPLSLPESYDETPSEVSGAISPSKGRTTTLHINLLSPSSKKVMPFSQQSPTAALPKESETPSHAVTPTEQNAASVEEEAVETVQPAEEENQSALEKETPPASVEDADNQLSSRMDQSKVRFTIATAWQRSLSVEDADESLTPPSSPPAGISSSSSAVIEFKGVEVEATTKEDPQVKAEPAGSAKVEVMLSPGRVRNAGTTIAKPQSSATSLPSPIKLQTPAAASSEGSSVVVEGNTDNPFGIRLRKTSVLHRFSSEEENAEAPIEPEAQATTCKVDPPQPITVKPSIIPPVSNKPALPKKPDIHGDGAGKHKRFSDPRGVSGGSDSPSWISVAKQKQKIYKESSLEEITVKKEEQERKSSLPVYVSSAASSGSKTAESTSKVSLLEISKPSVSVQETKRVLSPPTPVPSQPPNSQSLPCPLLPKPQVPPATTKHPPQRSLSPLTPVPFTQKSPSCKSPPSLSKTATAPKMPQPQSTTVTSPPFSSRTAPEKCGSRVPGLYNQAPSSQRGLPAPALPQDEPPWMALAKKKAKAWSEMPQIVQ